MPIKDLLQRFQPADLYIILVLSICYFSVQLVLSHFTHALTLLMASYHMLCNIFALAGCIITIKHSKKKGDNEISRESLAEESLESKQNGQEKAIVVSLGGEDQTISKQQKRAMKLRNTFGWTRIDILTMLIVCIILASLSFSLLVEALQTLVHIDHQDTMHLPIPVLILGFVGLVLNGITYFLIGGYTMHQGSFLHLTPSGNVVLDRAMSNSGELKLNPVARQLSRSKNDQHLKEELEKEIGAVHVTPKRQGAVEMLRDVSSTIFVIVCAFIVYMAEDEEHTAKFIDPILSIFSCVLLVSLSYPYMKESCLILLQTIPGCINMENFEKNLAIKFPEIVSYHDLHIWQLSAQKYVATIHIKFQNPKLYTQIIEHVRNYFHEHGITEITIQPEFDVSKASAASLECLVQCNAPECIEKVCCKDSRTDLREISVSSSSVKSIPFKSSVESLKMIKDQANRITKSHSIEVIPESRPNIKENHTNETESLEMQANGNSSSVEEIPEMEEASQQEEKKSKETDESKENQTLKETSQSKEIKEPMDQASASDKTLPTVSQEENENPSAHTKDNSQ